MSHVQIFDRPCCGPSEARKLADFLSARVASKQGVEYFDLNDSAPAADSVPPVPASVVRHIAASGPLPVLVVDGQIAASGTMPDLMTAMELLRGRANPTTPLTLTPASADACLPGCC